MRLRSLLFAPAVRSDLVMKLSRHSADAVVIDCEDATPPAAKEAGRRNAFNLGTALANAGAGVFVRVNGPESPWFEDDINEGLPSNASGIVVPMVECTEQLDRLASLLTRSDSKRLCVIIGLETAAGVADARTLLGHQIVAAGYFGAEDFIADVGGKRTPENLEVLHARSAIALAGGVARVPVLDQVVVDFGDLERFRREATEARALGYRGKLCIHPGQVAVAHRVFTPTDSEVEAALRIINAYDSMDPEGSAVAVVEGRMVDLPMVMQARGVVASFVPSAEGGEIENAEHGHGESELG